MEQVMISYSRDDSAWVYSVLETELRRRYAVWIDKQIPSSVDWWNSILDAIEQSAFVVVALSPESVASIYCSAELDYALDLGKPILPLIVARNCPYPERLRQIRTQYIDVPKLEQGEFLSDLQHAIGEIRVRLARGEYLPTNPRPPRPPVPTPKVIPQDPFDLFAAAETAYGEGAYDKADELFAKVEQTDPHGFGAVAVERRAEIKLERERNAAYLNVVRLAANPAMLKGAQAAWRVYIQKYGHDHDPNDLATKLANAVKLPPVVTVSPSPTPASVVGAQHVVPNSKSTTSPDLANLTRRVLTILPPPFDWCDIPAGKVTIEYSDTDKKEFPVERFAIAKYPITNAQYQVFAREGYRDTQWWDYSKEAQAWRKEHSKPNETAYAGDDLPRTKVSWYESLAFCRWLSAQIVGVKHALPSQITLPTEQQWQRAAQGDDNRVYPWDSKFDSQRCNIEESGIGKPTPVTQYPNGASPYGVLDMSGNVWEWCLTTWEDDKTDLSGSDSRVLRGGSFNLNLNHAAASFRYDFNPFVRSFDYGFRVVCAAPFSAL